MTPKQAAVVHFVRRYGAEHRYPPTIREIARGAGYASPGATLEAMRRLRGWGLLTFEEGKARTARVVTV